MYPRHLRPAQCERSSEDGSDGSEDWQRGPATGSERIGSEEQQREEQQRVQHPEPKKYGGAGVRSKAEAVRGGGERR
eukprot:CAMPEP_0174722172 /NCGR_PEP_ID=MMETSP1094-20130205/37754_1 /TAXON_ID=156173 /ORGANISM="Chrysochromulina brevifilum, Strain UTEX LB 985" /LENGTH=76 /DNA_ID=CAMNT_0015922971 /DNA_START=418 /DNA_END=648 /DNA_ORIENTATION=+